MLKSLPLFGSAAAAAVLLLTPASAQATPIGPYASICKSGQPAVLARVSGFKEASGTVAVKLYKSNPKTFLEKGAYVRKVEVPVTRSTMEICVPVPSSGNYAISVRHEVNGRKSRSDGGGFSGNPDVSTLDLVLKRKPKINEVSFAVGGGTRVVPVTLNYLQGGSFRPIS